MLMRRNRASGIPRDTGSARLFFVFTYLGRKRMFAAMHMTSVRLMESFTWKFRLRPLSMAPITPMLSPRTTISASRAPSCSRNLTASSMAAISAQPMSLPLRFHCAVSKDHLQAAQASRATKPMPQSDDASTQMSGSQETLRGRRGRAIPGVSRVRRHHSRSLSIDGVGYRGAKRRACSPKDAMNAHRLVRKARPCG